VPGALRSAEQGGRYRWLSSRTKKRPNGATAHLSNGENPITVARPNITSGKLVNSVVGMAEGVLKPFIACQQQNKIMLGAAGGQFASSPQTLKITLDNLSVEFGFPPRIAFYPDAGCLENQNVLKQYRATWKLLQELGYEVSIAWWGQFTKDDPDIDELEDFEALDFISVEQFWKLAGNLKQERWKAQTAKAQAALNSLTHEPTLKLNQQYLSDIHLPENGGYLFISSPMGTGKTTQLADLIAEYRSRRPDGRTRSIGHRNGLLRQTGKKLNIPLLVDLDYQQSEEKEQQHKLTPLQVSKLPAVGLCINSLLRLDPDLLDSLSGALLIFDEVDAVLKSLLTSKLLKQKRAHIMAHLQRIARHVLSTGGYIVGMEANLTDLSIDFLRGIGGTEYPMQLVCNEWRGQPWDVTVYDNSGATWMQAIARFKGRQVVMTDSQKFAEQLDRYLTRGDRSAATLTKLTQKEASCESFEWMAERQKLPRFAHFLLTLMPIFKPIR
jgi:hypothetical protein